MKCVVEESQKGVHARLDFMSQLSCAIEQKMSFNAPLIINITVWNNI